MLLRVLIGICLLVFSGTATFAFDLQGHRGARGLKPENTLPAFAEALSIGVSTLEFDTGVTKDGIVVISHNRALDGDITRDAAGNWINEEILINGLTFEEIQAFDVGRVKDGSNLAKRFAQQTAVDGTRIPALSQLFELVEKSKNTHVRFNIETKINPLKPEETVDPQSFAEALVAVVKKFGMEARTTIQSFDWRTLQIVQKADPNIETVYLSAQQDWMDTIAQNDGIWTAGHKISDYNNSVPKMVKALGGAVWSPFFGDVSAEVLQEAKAAGLKVIPWTVNDRETMVSLINLGVDGLISDYPDMLRSVLKELGIELPPATPVKP